MMNLHLLKSLTQNVTTHTPSSPWVFAIRTTLASLIALYIAFLMNLDDPKWAAMTVWIVAQPHRGMTLSKSQYRIVGTVIGAAMALVLTALFAQTPEMFLLALAAWIGICTWVASSLRNFRAYAGVLAGYTAAIVGMGAASAPLQAFDVAIARCLYIVLGIVVEAVLAGCFSTYEPARDLRARFDGYVGQAAGLCARLLRRQPDSEAMQRLFASAVTLDTAAEFAGASSATVRRELGRYRAMTLAVLSQLAAAQTLGEQLSRRADVDNQLVEESARLLDRVAVALPDASAARIADAVAAMKGRVELALRDEGAAMVDADGSRLIVLNRLRLLLAATQNVIACTAQDARGDPAPSRPRLAYHIDAVLAWRNGMRAFAAVLAASAFWIFSAWPSGAGFVTITGVVSALFSTRPNAVGVSVAFLKGAVCAALVAAICNFALLPAISDFVPLACIIAIAMIGAGLAMCHPRAAAVGSGMSVFFWNFISPLNSARIDDATFFNGAVATLIGIAFGAAVFSILLPADPLAIGDRLRRAARHDLLRFAGRPMPWQAEAFLARTADRLSRLLALGSTEAAIRERHLQGHIAAWAMSHSLVTMRDLASRHVAARRLLTLVQRRVQAGDFEGVARVSRTAAVRLQRRTLRAPYQYRRDDLAGVILLHSIADRAIHHAQFLRGEASA